jgi:hypothetical protein
LAKWRWENSANFSPLPKSVGLVRCAQQEELSRVRYRHLLGELILVGCAWSYFMGNLQNLSGSVKGGSLRLKDFSRVTAKLKQSVQIIV